MIKFKNIHLSYDKIKIIKDLNLEISKNDKILITGKSGSGKTSLFSLILGFSRPDSGNIYFDNMTVNANNIWNIRQKIAYVDQNVSIQNGKIQNILKNITNLKSNTHLTNIEESLNKLLDYFELHSKIVNKNIDNLSGGEKQRLAIVISILLNRKVFFLDEITSALDKNLKKKVADYFIEKKNCTSVIISHDSVWRKNMPVKIFNFEECKWEL